MDITIDETKAVIQHVSPLWHRPVKQMDILRLDLVHPVISGNKWYKLKHNLKHARHEGYKTIITFGGPYSNHLIATAAATKAARLTSIGIVRGLYAGKQLTPTLQACMDMGMQLRFAAKEQYANKEHTEWQEQLKAEYGNAFIIPEGGANECGRMGAGSIADMITNIYTHVCVSVGSGTTFIGIGNKLPASQQLMGFVPMMGGAYLKDYVQQYLPTDKSWQLFDRWHFGGFAKWNKELLTFMNDFYMQNNIPLDVVYTGKMMYGVSALLNQGYFSTDDAVLCIHTGGLQGNTSVANMLIY